MPAGRGYGLDEKRKLAPGEIPVVEDSEVERRLRAQIGSGGKKAAPAKKKEEPAKKKPGFFDRFKKAVDPKEREKKAGL